MTWTQLQSAGKVKPHQTSKQEIDDLRAVVVRDLDDAAIQAISDDRRFATAYNAALQTAKIVIACSGFRVTGQGHHQTTFEAIELAIGNPVAAYSAFFDACRRKRNQVDYDLSGIATRTEVDQLIQEAANFVVLCETWIDQNHPALSR